MEYEDDYEVSITITVHVTANSQEEADELVSVSESAYGLPVLNYENGVIVADCSGD